MITKITQNDLNLHARWLRDKSDGVRLVTATGTVEIDVDLSSVDLSGADLSGADMRGANLSNTSLRNTDLIGVDLRGVDLRGADLRHANLSDVDLRGADLRGARLDDAAVSLWYGSTRVVVDRSIAAQLVAYVCALDCDNPNYQALRKLMLPFARSSHRAGELGLLGKEQKNE